MIPKNKKNKNNNNNQGLFLELLVAAKNAFHYFVELVVTNPLMYNMKDFDRNEVPLFVWRSWYRRTDRIDFGMYSQRPFEWCMTRLSKLKISWRRGKQYTCLITLGGRHNSPINYGRKFNLGTYTIWYWYQCRFRHWSKKYMHKYVMSLILFIIATNRIYFCQETNAYEIYC